MTLVPVVGAAAEFHILRYEQVTLSETIHPQSATYRTASPGMSVRFRAYGTEFALDLERNDRLNEALPAARRAATVAWRGTVVGKPGSWVRLTRFGNRIVGMLSDGAELYTIESGADARPHIRNPLARVADDAVVIYKLRDTLTDLAGEFCGVLLEAGKSTQADVYHALAAQMQSEVTTSLVATKQLEVGAVADAELSQAQSNNTEAFVLARLNVVDGIFSDQVGVHLAVRSITTYPQGDDPFSSTTVPSDLLAELQNFRGNSPTQQGTGLTHLMTGRDLDNNTVGIAYFDTLCSIGTSASLSQTYQQSFTNAALIAAHEIGHVFGAPHDGEGACASQTGAFIMASQLNQSQQFSPCSLSEMQSRVNLASCLAPVAQADAALVVPASAPLALEQTTVVSFQVRSEGPGAISGVQVTVALPPGILAVGAGATGGTCTVSGAIFQIVCSFATIPVGESREVQMSLQGLSSGTSNASITLTASGDGVSSNNSAQLALVTAPGADLSVSVTASATAIDTNATSIATITVNNLSAVAAAGTQLVATFPAGLAAVSVAANGLRCSVDAASVFSCTAVTLAANSSQSVALTIRGTSAGSRRLSTAVTSNLGDPDASNNTAGVTLTVTDPVVVVSPSPGGGGGGALGSELLALGVALGLSRRRLQHRPSGH